MDCGEEDTSGVPQASENEESRSAVNSLILDYYKKFGRKRDLEQYFSLSTAQSDIRDPSSPFWMSMKTEDSSDSGDKSDKKSESPQELCRISITCSVPDPCTSQEEDSKTKTESVSPPIIIEEVFQDSRLNSEDDAMKSDDNHSQKSFDVLLDTSTNKPLSPSSSITSQRKLEWDSLADVGYGNESDRKTSASSLSTLERLALKQQYTNNDTQKSDIGPPTSHSTPLEDDRSKVKKGAGKKTKIYKKDVDFLEVNVPSSSSNPSPSINVNLTKHISFNVEKDGKITVGNVQKDVSVSPEKVEEVHPLERMDKEIQTSLLKTKEATSSTKPEDTPQKIPILIGLNTLRRTRRKRYRMARRKLKYKKKPDKDISGQDRSVAEQLSEAESFEYMPGHIYNQNQMTANEHSSNVAGNKSSLESSAAHTTESSKGSKHSFTKDLEKGIDLLKNALQNRCDDAELKKKLIKQVCQRLLNSQYRDDDSNTTDFLSGLSFGSKRLGLDHHTTTSTSENNSTEKSKRPKKSILRSEKFNAGSIASTSQSAPNLPIASKSDKLVTSHLMKTFTSSNTDSDMSSKDKTSSDNAGPKTTSDALYQKYLQALKQEEAYKRHLKDKEMFLKQKLVSSDSALKVPVRAEKPNIRLKDLINDLTRNNYNDGSGDASKLEGRPGSSRDFDRLIPNRSQRSHSVFTLSSGNSDGRKKPNLKKKLQCDIKDLSKPGPSKDTHYCCCPHHTGYDKIVVADSSVQVNIKNPCTDENCPARQRISPRLGLIAAPILAEVTSEGRPGDINYVCHCQMKDIPNNISILTYPQFPTDVQVSEKYNEILVQPCINPNCPSTSRGQSNAKCGNVKSTANNLEIKRLAKSSQTNMLLKMLRRKSSDQSVSSVGISSQGGSDKNIDSDAIISRKQSLIYETTRCIQTEISIDPRIAEPTLSDINIVNESECVKVISEHCRKSSKSSITDLYIPPIDAETCTNSDSIKSSGTSNNRYTQFLDDKSLSNDDAKTYNVEKNNLNTQSQINSGNFAIPIQGTNMTLMVSVGNDCINKKTESIGTVPVGIAEQATSLDEECTKGEQTNRDRLDHNSNCMFNRNDKEVVKFSTNPITSTLIGQNVTYSYNELGIDRSAQTNSIKKHDAETQENVPIFTQTSNHDVKDSNLEDDIICSCGCFNSEQTCKGKCKVNVDKGKNCVEKRESKDFQCNTDTPRSENKEKLLSQNLEQIVKYRRQSLGLDTNSLINKPIDKCPCGCNGSKEDCQKGCVGNIGNCPQENVGTPREPCPKQLYSSNVGEKCLCGCGGTKDNCQKNCTDKTVLAGEGCRKQSLHKDSRVRSHSGDNDTRKQSLGIKSDGPTLEKSENCPCGCGGSIDKCAKDCSERKTSLLETISPKSNKNCLLETNFKFEDCACGCGNSKDNCKENCSYSKTSQKLLSHCYKIDVGTQKDVSNVEAVTQSTKVSDEIPECNSKEIMTAAKGDSRSERIDNGKDRKSSSEAEQTDSGSDPILNLIKDITKRYSKREGYTDKSKRKKCFKDIVLALNYLLETDDCNEEGGKGSERLTTPEDSDHKSKKVDKPNSQNSQKKLVDKGVQLPRRPSKTRTSITQSSDVPASTDIPSTSSDSAACKVLSRIKKECEKYHQKRCKVHSGKKCDASSSTSVNCDQCRRIHHCACRSHRCKGHKKSAEKIQKDPVAYNLILQTSESVISEGVVCEKNRQLKNIIVKVPKKKPMDNIPFKEMASKFEKNMPSTSPRNLKTCRSRSLPNESEISSMDEIMRKSRGCTVREYLEKNRPDFVERCSQRQNCLKYISESRCANDSKKQSMCQPWHYHAAKRSSKNWRILRASERAVQRDMLAMYMAQLPDVTTMDSDGLRQLARDLGQFMRKKKTAPKFISEREMKQRSQKIYKSLPEVVQKKEEVKKENIKKTNLLMANIFKKNLQKNTLRGSVNISNYSTVVKI